MPNTRYRIKEIIIVEFVKSKDNNPGNAWHISAEETVAGYSIIKPKMTNHLYSFFSKKIKAGIEIANEMYVIIVNHHGLFMMFKIFRIALVNGKKTKTAQRIVNTILQTRILFSNVSILSFLAIDSVIAAISSSLLA